MPVRVVHMKVRQTVVLGTGMSAQVKGPSLVTLPSPRRKNSGNCSLEFGMRSVF